MLGDMMGFLIRLVVAIFLAVGLGVSSALEAISNVAESGFVKNGVWHTAPVDSPKIPNFYVQAAIAKSQLLRPPGEKILLFNATIDGTGEPLNGACRYRLAGPQMPARAWSISAYDARQNLIANSENRYAFGLLNAANEDETDAFELRLSGEAQAGAWLPINSAEKFSLTLRLYTPHPSVLNDPTSFKAPSIIRESCQ